MRAGEPVPVLQVIDTLGRGGAERVLITIANELDPARFASHVLLTRSAGPLASDVAPHVPVMALGRRSRLDLDAIRRFSRVTTRRGIRIVHTHAHTAAYFVRIARPFTAAPFFHVVHDHHGPVEASPVLRAADRMLLRGVDYYFAVSERLTEYARRSIGVPASRSETLLNGVSPASAIGSEKETRFTIVQVARLVPDKNQMLAIEAAAVLRETVPDFQWWLIGRLGSRYADECAALVERHGLSRHVTLMGERSDARELIARAHVGVLTSNFEGTPIALLEYMAENLPVVVTDAGDCGAIVRAAEGGAVTPLRDVRSLVDALVPYAGSREKSERDGARNRAFVDARYSTRAMIARISAVYEELLASPALGRDR